ncbi:MAG TPA: hypothetical protein VF013_08150 [Candidatus Limnocylindria bacterium]
MAVIGARPATGIGVFGRRSRVRPRPAPRPRSGAGRRRREAASISSVLVAIAAAALLGIFYLTQSGHVLATGYQIDELRTQLAEAQAQQAQLVYRIGEARSPAVIERIARGRLRLVPLPPSSVTFAQAPAAAPSAGPGATTSTSTIDTAR